MIHRDNVKWATRMGLILVLVALAVCMVVEFVRKPLPWVVLIPLALPILNLVFVQIPFLKVD